MASVDARGVELRSRSLLRELTTLSRPLRPSRRMIRPRTPMHSAASSKSVSLMGSLLAWQSRMARRASIRLPSPSRTQSHRKAACSMATLRRSGCEPGSRSVARRDAFSKRFAA